MKNSIILRNHTLPSALIFYKIDNILRQNTGTKSSLKKGEVAFFAILPPTATMDTGNI